MGDVDDFVGVRVEGDGGWGFDKGFIVEGDDGVRGDNDGEDVDFG